MEQCVLKRRHVKFRRQGITLTPPKKKQRIQHLEYDEILNQDSKLYWFPELACTVRLKGVKLILLYT